MGEQRTSLGFYCPGAGTGGPWRYVHSLLAWLDPAEFDATVFCDLPGRYEPRPSVRVVRLSDRADVGPGWPEAAPNALNRPARFKLARLAPRPLRLWGGFGREALRLARLIRRHPVDVFHTQNTGCEESPVAAALAGVRRIVGTFHVDSTYDLHRARSGPLHRFLEVASNRCLDRAIAVSHATRQDWIRRTHIPAERVLTIHNGIDPARFCRRMSRAAARGLLGLPADGAIVGGIGRLDEAKGFAYLIDAAARLRSEFPRLCLVIAGEGPLRKDLESHIVRLGLSDRVRLLGFQSDVQPVLDALDVFALPSLCETLGYVLLEAMATEVPTVGAAVGGVPEVIVPGTTGFVVPPRDPARLAAAIRTLLLDPELRARMGSAGRERVVRQFQERDMVRKTVNLYRQMLRGRRSRRPQRRQLIAATTP